MICVQTANTGFTFRKLSLVYVRRVATGHTKSPAPDGRQNFAHELARSGYVMTCYPRKFLVVSLNML